MPKTVLLISTSANNMNGHPTGLWLEELAEPFNVFCEAGFKVSIASILGGRVPIDKISIPYGIPLNYRRVYKLLRKTIPLEKAMKRNYDVILFAGGHGAIVDFPNNKNVQNLILRTYDSGKLVSTICHGAAALVNVKNASGKYFVAGKKLTCFTNGEEETAGLVKKVPFLLETKLKEEGAIIEKGPNYTSTVVEDKNLITGQDPQSSHDLAQKIVQYIQTQSK